MKVVDLQFRASWAVGGALEVLRDGSQSSVADVTVFRRNHNQSDIQSRPRSSPVRCEIGHKKYDIHCYESSPDKTPAQCQSPTPDNTAFTNAGTICNDTPVRPHYTLKPPLGPLVLVSHTLRPQSFYPGSVNVIISQSPVKWVNSEAISIVRSILFSLTSHLPIAVDSKTKIHAYKEEDEVSSSTNSTVKSDRSSGQRDQAIQVHTIKSDTNESKPAGSASVENGQSCECLGGVRALRNSHVRLLLRQLRQLRHIEKLDRTLHRLHVSKKIRTSRKL